MITIPGKIPVHIYPIFWLLALLIGWLYSFTILGAVILGFVVFISVLVHEYGHALSALAFGQQSFIELVGLGGVTQRQGKRLSLGKEFIIILNGPLAGLALAILSFLILLTFGKGLSSVWLDILKFAFFANVFWTVVNLLPIYPLDGGRLFSIILEALFGVKGVRASFLLSSLFAFIISIASFSIGYVIGGAFFMLFAFESFQAWRSTTDMIPDDQDNRFQELLTEAEEDLKQQRSQEGKDKLEKIRHEVGHGLIYNSATESLAGELAKEGQHKEAYEMLMPIEKRLAPKTIKLLHQLAYSNHDWSTTTRLGNQVYQWFPNHEVALMNAISNAVQMAVQPTLGWLERALEDGLPNPQSTLERTEFDFLRNNPQYQSLRKHYR